MGSTVFPAASSGPTAAEIAAVVAAPSAATIASAVAAPSAATIASAVGTSFNPLTVSAQQTFNSSSNNVTVSGKNFVYAVVVGGGQGGSTSGQGAQDNNGSAKGGAGGGFSFGLTQVSSKVVVGAGGNQTVNDYYTNLQGNDGTGSYYGFMGTNATTRATNTPTAGTGTFGPRSGSQYSDTGVIIGAGGNQDNAGGDGFFFSGGAKGNNMGNARGGSGGGAGYLGAGGAGNNASSNTQSGNGGNGGAGGGGGGAAGRGNAYKNGSASRGNAGSGGNGVVILYY